jgi:hypothetical protein
MMTAEQRLQAEYGKVNMDVLLEGGGFFCRRDNAALRAIRKAQRDAFFAGFKRSDSPPPSEEKIEAAYLEWLQQN